VGCLRPQLTPPLVAEEAGEPEKRLVGRVEAGEAEERPVRGVEAGEPEKRPVGRVEAGEPTQRPVRRGWRVEESAAEARWRLEAMYRQSPASGGPPRTACPVSRSTSRSPAGSTRSPKWRKKSTPRIGNWTAAKIKGQRKTFPLKDNRNCLSPQHGMGRPAAPAKAGPTGGLAEE
jgi:hypothetical protein